MADTLEQELITADEYHEQGNDEEVEEANRLNAYHQQMMELMDDLPPRGVPSMPGLNRKRVMQAFQDSFELIGGVPRLALWAHENPGDFYKLYTKLLPSQSVNLIQQNKTIIKHVVPRSALDE